MSHITNLVQDQPFVMISHHMLEVWVMAKNIQRLLITLLFVWVVNVNMIIFIKLAYISKIKHLLTLHFVKGYVYYI